MKGRHAIAVAASSLLAISCGRFGGAELEKDAPATPDAAGVPEPIETRATDFGCGPATCSVGRDVCCLIDGGAACAPAQSGCGGSASADGGGRDAGPPAVRLSCVTYRNCNGNDVCCWSKENGSVCKDGCDGDELSLCRDGDRCDDGERCERIERGDTPLPPEIRECRREQGGSGGFGHGAFPGN